MNDEPSSIESLYLDMELFDLTAPRPIEPRDHIQPLGRPFPGLGISEALDVEGS